MWLDVDPVATIQVFAALGSQPDLPTFGQDDSFFALANAVIIPLHTGIAQQLSLSAERQRVHCAQA